MISIMPADDDLYEQAYQIGRRLRAQGNWLSSAESCTGGWLGKVLTDVPGGSAWYDRGFITYNNQAKHDMLGVSEETLVEYGAVSVVSPMIRRVVAPNPGPFTYHGTGTYIVTQLLCIGLLPSTALGQGLAFLR